MRGEADAEELVIRVVHVTVIPNHCISADLKPNLVNDLE